MSQTTANKNLHKAKNAKKDEFYTQLTDIENELRHYRHHFKNKVVYCNCDDPRVSNFFHYFSYNFEDLGLKKLITTCYQNQHLDLFSQHNSEQAIYLEYYGDRNKNRVPDLEEIGVQYLKGDGDFRSTESIALLQQADIVVTNPPFSLFREYVAQLIDYRKKFVIVGNHNAITYKEVFPHIKENRIWLGYKYGDMAFKVPKNYEPRETRYWKDDNGQKWRSFGNMCWYTNLDIAKRHEGNPGVYNFFEPENEMVEHRHITDQLREKIDQINEYQGDKTAFPYLKLVLSCVYIHYVKGLSIISLPEAMSIQKMALEFDSDIDTELLQPIVERNFDVLT